MVVRWIDRLIGLTTIMTGLLIVGGCCSTTMVRLPGDQLTLGQGDSGRIPSVNRSGSIPGTSNSQDLDFQPDNNDILMEANQRHRCKPADDADVSIDNRWRSADGVSVPSISRRRTEPAER